MEKLKLLWLAPEVQFEGLGIAEAWRNEMARKGWDFTNHVDEADLTFFSSDSQLNPDLIGQKPTLCYDAATEVLTKHGFKLFSQLNGDEELATLNPSTGYLEYHRAIAHQHLWYEGTLITFRGQLYDLAVTPEHAMFAQVGRKGPFGFYPAASLLKRQVTLKLDALWKGTPLETFSVPHLEEHGNRLHCYHNLPIDAWLHFFGWWITEGSVTRHKGSWRLDIGQWDNGRMSRILDSIRAIGAHPWVDGHLAQFYSRELGEYLLRFGHAHRKYLPPEIKALPPNKLQLLLDVMLEGDGTTQATGHQLYSTASRQLADDVQEIAVKVGMAASVKQRASGVYDVSLNRKKLTPRIHPPEGHISHMPYRGYVYDVTVPNHTLYVRRNGKAVWSGNCYFWGWPPWRLLEPAFRQFAEARLGMMARCTRVLVPSPCVYDQLCDFGIPSQICMPGVDARALEQGASGPREDRVVFIGRLDAPQKNLDLLIRALGMVKPPPPLLILGPGNPAPFQEMARRLEVPVSFAEPNDTEKAHILKTSAVLAHPSSYEGFGLPPLEALYCGTPTIVLAIPHMLWLTRGRAYFVSDEGQMAQLIIHILTHPQEALEMASGGQEQVKAFLTLEHACDRLWAHIHQTIKEHLAQELREKPAEWARIYDDEHRRNWAYSIDRFDPTWERHWRSTTFIDLLKECGAKKILDVGCGAVYPTIFARAGFEVTALDISPECVRQVEAVALKWGVMEKVFTEVGDAHHLDFPDTTFGAVVQGELWEHVPDARKVIEEGLRVLKTGGYLIATTPIGHSHWDPMHMGPVEGGWDDATLKELLRPWEGQVKRLEKIAEERTEPSCFLIVLEKT